MAKNKFDLDHQYDLYLQRVDLNENTMRPEQKLQVKDAFYGGIGQFLMLTQTDIVELSEEEACNVLDDIESQISNYFLSRSIS
ncbi:hypothetical protein [Flavobacterium phage FL-1]|nr:hypothetical protein [Flavobacterium phage FL-1]